MTKTTAFLKRVQIYFVPQLAYGGIVHVYPVADFTFQYLELREEFYFNKTCKHVNSRKSVWRRV